MSRLTVSFAVALACSAAALGTGCATSTAEMKATAGDPAGQFFAETGMSSNAEIAASQVALKKSSDPAVKQFAQMMVDDHTKMNTQLMQLAKQKGQDVPKHPDELHVKASAHLSQVQDPKMFDAEYVSMMVADHARTLSVMQDKAKMAPDPDVKQFAAAQVPILQMHLDHARALNARLGGGSTVGAGAPAPSGRGMDGMGSGGGTGGSGVH